MADISKIKLPGEELVYDLKDSVARGSYTELSAQLSDYCTKNQLDSLLRYELVNAELVLSSESLTCAINDQTITTISISSDSTPVIIQLPEKNSNGARDFILRVEISATTVPGFTFVGAGNETVQYDSEDDEWYVLEPGLNLVSFTETK